MTDLTDYELIEDRLISGRGLLQIPQDDDWRNFYVFVDLIRTPNREFDSSKYNPSKSEYAKMLWLQANYVVRETAVNFPQQRFTHPAQDDVGYLIPYLDCNFTGIGDALAAIATRVGLTVLPRETFYEVSPLRNGVDSINFVCRDSSALQVRLYGIKVHKPCGESFDKKKPPPTPPPSLPPVPKDEGIGVSPPYSSPDDGGATIPNELDVIDTPNIFPVGDTCEEVLVTFRYSVESSSTGEVRVLNGSVVGFGPVEDVFMTPTPPSNFGQPVNFVLRGRGVQGITGCLSSESNTVFFGTSGATDAYLTFEVLTAETQ